MAGSSANVNDFLLGRDNGEGQFLQTTLSFSTASMASSQRSPISSWETAS
jgi:hypothetical protein